MLASAVDILSRRRQLLALGGRALSARSIGLFKGVERSRVLLKREDQRRAS
jgi:hypothetical protein